MKVIFISNHLPPAIDGVGDYTFFLAEQFVEHGHDVILICSEQAEVDANILEEMTVYPMVENWDRKNVQAVVDLINQLKPDAVSLQYVPYGFHPKGQPWVIAHLAKQLRQQQVFLSTTFHEVAIRYSPKYTLRAFLQRLVARSIARHSDKVITSIDFYVDYLDKWVDEVELIQIGSNIPAVYIPEEQIKDLQQQIAPNNEFIIATFGKRDHVVLLRWFEQLVRLRPNTKLLICGKTPDIQIKEELKKHIHITGFLSRKELFKYLSCSDMFVQISMGKGGICSKSGSLAAAFAAGLPILGNKGDMTNQDLLESGAIIFIPKNGQTNWDELLKVMDNPVQLAEQAERVQLYHERFLDWRTIYEAYVDFWSR
ncbi:MAG: glycosyltransferase family 4 protein [Bacteroidota bacterium]